MKPIRVNADYEISLFEGKQAKEIINHSLEFLALYLDHRPLVSSKKYSQEYLSHVELLSGKKPSIIQTKDFENWWGDLKNLELEKTLNSKEFSAALSEETLIISSIEELHLLSERTYLAKNPYGMSGQNFIVFNKGEEDKIQPLLKRNRKLIIEPFFQRAKDFSHYVFADDTTISYENIVDENFQYKGTIFQNLNKPDLQSLSFFHEIDETEWKKFEGTLKRIIEAVRESGAPGGFSVDSFTYRKNNALKIRSLSEINYRKTMGLMAWLLSKKFQRENLWSMFVLGKALNNFSYVQSRVKSLQGCFYLSPGDTRFDMYLILARSPEEGRDKYESLRRLVPDGQFPIKL
jgi:hypothetical protein